MTMCMTDVWVKKKKKGGKNEEEKKAKKIGDKRWEEEGGGEKNNKVGIDSGAIRFICHRSINPARYKY